MRHVACQTGLQTISWLGHCESGVLGFGFRQNAAGVSVSSRITECLCSVHSVEWEGDKGLSLSPSLSLFLPLSLPLLLIPPSSPTTLSPSHSSLSHLSVSHFLNLSLPLSLPLSPTPSLYLSRPFPFLPLSLPVSISLTLPLCDGSISLVTCLSFTFLGVGHMLCVHQTKTENFFHSHSLLDQPLAFSVFLTKCLALSEKECHTCQIRSFQQIYPYK